MSTLSKVSVEHTVGLLAQGWTENEIIENFPRLTKDPRRCALTDAARFVRLIRFRYWVRNLLLRLIRSVRFCVEAL